VSKLCGRVWFLPEGKPPSLPEVAAPRPASRVTTDALLAWGVALHLSVPDDQIAVTRRCLTCGSRTHGKPLAVWARSGRVAAGASCSHSGGLTAIATTSHEVGLGVDVEDARRPMDWRTVHEQAFTPTEWASISGCGDISTRAYRAWVRKEAALKATGEGLLVEPRHVTVTGPADSAGWLPYAWTSRLITAAGPQAFVRDLAAPAGYVAAIAVTRLPRVCPSCGT